MRKPFDQDFLTRSIVGKPKMYRLGVLSRPLGGPTLVASEAAAEVAPVLNVQRALREAWTRPRVRWGAAATGGVFAAILASMLLPRQERVQPSPVIAAASSTAPEVTISPSLPLAPASAAASDLPVLPPTSAIGISTGTFVQPSASLPKDAVATPSSRPGPASKPEQDKAPAAVVLDASAKPQTSAPSQPAKGAPAVKVEPPGPAQPAATPAPAAGPRLVAPTREVAPGAGELKPAESGPRVNVVDIDKAGAFALITNPQTRLPEKVSVGQKIFTGETVKKIDAATGKVYLDNRAISMQ